MYLKKCINFKQHFRHFFDRRNIANSKPQDSEKQKVKGEKWKVPFKLNCLRFDDSLDSLKIRKRFDIAPKRFSEHFFDFDRLQISDF